ncbi:hypothetical protein [Agromyces sp. Marseille-Q5079]|uniref:hypothetical protein n=1 Tax=Agromyces sp. Marseille-Q5079 TaxID=3439059 RepID=UPI003D9CBBF1
MNMPVVRCRRRDDGDVSEFGLEEVPEALVPGVQKSGFELCDGVWVRRFPADSPQLEVSWTNFQRLIGPWLRQAANLEPAPWDDALSEVCRRLNAAEVDWWLTGSAALAARGLRVSPGDLDLVVSGPDAQRVGDLLADGLVEPVAPADWFCDWWGRAIIGARVEWVGGVGAAADQPAVSDFGPEAAARLERIEWRGHELRVPPLELQRAVSVRRGLHERVRMIDAAVGYRRRSAGQ